MTLRGGSKLNATMMLIRKKEFGDAPGPLEVKLSVGTCESSLFLQYFVQHTLNNELTCRVFLAQLREHNYATEINFMGYM